MRHGGLCRRVWFAAKRLMTTLQQGTTDRKQVTGVRFRDRSEAARGLADEERANTHLRENAF